MTQTVFLAFVYAAEAMIAYIYLKRLFTAKFSAPVTICGYFVLYAVLYGVSMVNSECRLFFLGQFDLAVFLFSKQFVDLVYPQRDIDGFDDGDRNHREFSFAVLCKGLCRIYV